MGDRSETAWILLRVVAIAAGFTSLMPLYAIGDTHAGGIKPTPRIVNGVPTADFAEVGLVGPGCTGTLIGCQTVLTAAHCVEGNGTEPADPAGYTVFFQHAGTFAVNAIAISPSWVRGVVVPGVGGQPGPGDLAVLRLVAPVSGIVPARLASIRPPFDTATTIVGFGLTGAASHDFGIKRTGTGRTVDCGQTAFSDSICSEPNPAIACSGDSGGPLFVGAGDDRRITGVLSGGTTDCQIGNIHVDVASHAAWILDVGGSDVRQAGNSVCGGLAPIGTAGTGPVVAEVLP